MTRLGQMLMDDGMEIKELENIKKLMKNTNWTIEQTMDMLEIPEEKRDKYRKTIVQNNYKHSPCLLYTSTSPRA